MRFRFVAVAQTNARASAAVSDPWAAVQALALAAAPAAVLAAVQVPVAVGSGSRNSCLSPSFQGDRTEESDGKHRASSSPYLDVRGDVWERRSRHATADRMS